MPKYFPKSQIKTNLYTKGQEYQYSLSQQEYKGYYYLTSKNQYYTGKYPGDFPNVELTKIQQTPNSSTPTPANSEQTSWVNVGNGYNKIFNKPPTIPTSIYPTPQNKDYSLGEFERYFLSKNNEIKFIEVNQLIFNQYKNQDPNVSYQLYSPFKMSWELTGDREVVYNVNKKTVERTQQQQQIPGFKSYFKERYDQFYKELG